MAHKRFPLTDLVSLIGREPPDIAANGLERVRSSDTARVYRCSVEVDGNPVVLYIKEYLSRTGFDGIKHLFRPSRAMRSFLAGMMLEANGLHSSEIVALLEKRSGPVCARNILITREMINARALYTFFEGDWPLESHTLLHDRRAMITELGKTIGQMHAAGIFHGDLRGGNLFVSQEPSGWRFYFIDNERTLKHRRLPSRLRIKNISQLNMLLYNITNTERMRFFNAYIHAAGLDKKTSKRLAVKVINRTLRRFEKRAQTRIGMSETSQQNHWDFQCARFGDHSGIFFKELCQGPATSEFIGQIESLMETGTVLKDDLSTHVVRCTWNHWDIVIKRYNHQSLWHSLRHTIKGSRANRCWRFGHQLQDKSIACAATLGLIEQRKAGLIWQSYIINEFIEGPLLYDVMNRGGYSETDRRAAMEKAEHLLNELGRHHLTHADMKPANMLICQGRPVLIDLDSMEQHRIRWYFRYRYNKMINYFHNRLHGKKKK